MEEQRKGHPKKGEEYIQMHRGNVLGNIKKCGKLNI